MQLSRVVTRFAFVTLLVAGCGGKKDEAPAPSPTPAPAATPTPAPAVANTDPKQVFMQRCVPCHGTSGQGDGPASTSLNPKPRKYADAAWQASVTDEYLMKAIKEGGAAVGKSPIMPANPDLDATVIAGLKDIVRAFNPK